MTNAPRRALGFADLFLYGLAMALGLRWIATAAAAGPGSVFPWVAAVVGFMAPLVIATAELTGRFPGEGGLYLWTRDALGPFWGFLTGWLYWTCNLPFFSGLLYFIVAALAEAAGPGGEALTGQPVLFAGLALVLAMLVGVAHRLGLGVGKWLSDIGSLATVGLLALLIGLGALAVGRGASATDFSHASYALPLNGDGAALWATMVFAFGGPEALAFLRGEAKGGMRQILKVLALIGVLVLTAYLAGTFAILAVVPVGEASRLTGVGDALGAGLARAGLAGLAPLALLVLALSMLGGYSAWFGVAARLPLAVGVDRFLPRVFARRDPRTGAPVTAIWVQTVAVLILVALGQAGASVKAAYDFLVAMSVLSYTVPFVFLFLVYLRVQARPAPAGVWSMPGGRRAARLIGAVGLAVTLSAIACTLVPSPQSTHPFADLAKLILASAVLIGLGVALYWARRPAAAGGRAGGEPA